MTYTSYDFVSQFSDPHYENLFPGIANRLDTVMQANNLYESYGPVSILLSITRKEMYEVLVGWPMAQKLLVWTALKCWKGSHQKKNGNIHQQQHFNQQPQPAVPIPERRRG